jgi:hypothetical protein
VNAQKCISVGLKGKKNLPSLAENWLKGFALTFRLLLVEAGSSFAFPLGQFKCGVPMKRVLLGLAILSLITTTSAQQPTKWYKFSKVFIDEHYSPDSAIGKLAATAVSPAASVHSISCGGNDGELHIGIAEKAVEWSQPSKIPFSANADEEDSEFGIVAEPVNLASGTKSSAMALKGNAASFTGYFRLWNEGHDAGAVHPSNPHHVLELHPVWGFDGADKHFSSPTSIRSMTGFQGYGASKFKPLLEGLAEEGWLHTYEDDDFVFVELQKAENFYQLPVKIKSVKDITGGVEATADVFSDENRTKLVLSDLRIVSNKGSRIATRLTNGEEIKFLLGVFSVNLRAAMEQAKGHKSEDDAVFAPSALEFFAYGVPLEHAVASSQCDDDNEADD